MNKCLLTPDMEPLTVQVRILSKSSLDEPNSFIGVIHSSVGEGLLAETESLQAARLVSASSRRLTCLKVSLSSPTINTSSGKKEPR